MSKAKRPLSTHEGTYLADKILSRLLSELENAQLFVYPQLSLDCGYRRFTCNLDDCCSLQKYETIFRHVCHDYDYDSYSLLMAEITFTHPELSTLK